MIVISDQTLTAFEADYDAGFAQRLHAWWCRHIDPRAAAHDTERLLFAHRTEFDLAGVREEEDRCLFLYARAMMPQMGDFDYLETMDAIFARRPVKDRVALIAAIAQRYGHRG